MIKLIYFFLQARLERGIDDPLTDLGTGCGQSADVVDIELGQAVGDAVSQRRAAIAVRQEIPISLRRGGKPARHAHAHVRELADHLAQGCILAADGLDIRHAQVFEGNDVSRPLIRGLMDPLGCYVGHDYYLFDDEKSS